MKKLIACLALAAFLVAPMANAQTTPTKEAPKKECCKDKKTCPADAKKECTKDTKKECCKTGEKKGACCEKKAEVKK